MKNLPKSTGENSGFPETADIETASDGYASRFSGAIGDYFLDVQAQTTLELLHDLSHASVLDVGGGHAQLAGPLVDRGFSVTVTGSADVCRTRLDNLLKPNSFQFKTCDSLNLPFDDNQFDVVMSFRLMPHVGQWQRLIDEMCRVAGKAIIIDYPDKRSSNIFYHILFNIKKNLEVNTRPFHLFHRKEVIFALQRNHFSKPLFKPQFFVPMVFHRKVNNVVYSRFIESIFKRSGLTSIFGSPIILRSNKLTKSI